MLESENVYNDLLKVARKESIRIKLAEAQDEDIEVRGQLSNGLMIRGILTAIDGDTATITNERGRSWKVPFDSVQTIEEIEDTVGRNVREEQKAMKPNFLSIDPIEFDEEGTVARFLGYLVGPGRVRLSLETPPKYRDMAVEQYRELTGETLEPETGIFNVSPEDKWALEAAIRFIPTENIPPVFAKLQIERPGLISRIQLFWSLVKIGFRLSKHQDPERIKLSLPMSQWELFDEGLTELPQKRVARKT